MKPTVALLSLLACCISNIAWAQLRSLSGMVIDAETSQPVPFAHVFLSNTTHVTVTDTEGRYTLTNIQPGPYQLAVSYLGYETFTQNIVIGDKNQQVDLRLIPQSQALDNVVVSATEDKVWKRNLKVFKRHFLGETDHARASQIVNPWVLEFDKRGSTLFATAEQPIEIVNQDLGYQLHFYLQQFEASSDAYRIVGPVRFQEIDDPTREAKWRQARASVFRGSVIHYLKALATGNAKAEGFRMYLPINALKEEARSLYFERDLGVTIKEWQAKDLLRYDALSGTYSLTAAKPLEVHFEPGQDYQPVYKDILHPVSWIQSTTGVVRFDKEGNVLNPTDVMVVGYWNRLRVADLLPLDYRPGKDEPEIIKPNLLVVTDKDVYKSGEKIWYTVFVTGTRAGSLSVQVDLVDSLNNVLQSRVDPVDWRKATGYFEVPARSGRTCFLRATTNDTYKEGLAYLKPVVLIPAGYTWLSEAKPTEKSLVERKPSFLYRTDTSAKERIVRVWLGDADMDTLSGNFLVSAGRALSDEAGLEGKLISFVKPSVGSNYRDVPAGKVLTTKGKPLQGRLSLVTTDLAYSLEKVLDETGGFVLDDLVVYDSVEWVAQFFDDKGKPQSDFMVVWNERTAFTVPDLTWRTPWRTRKMSVSGNISTTKEEEFKLADGTLMLKEITVRSKRERSEQPTFRTYGAAEYVIEGEELRGNPAGTNVLSALIGRVPGLVGAEGGTSWTGFTVKFNVRGNSSLMGATSESPLFIIDGMPIDDDRLAYDILQTIPLTDIERVEVRKGLSPLQATRKGSGTIAIYTNRSGSSKLLPDKNPNPFIKKTTLKGYAKPAGFSVSGQGTIHTWHWDPYASLGDGGYAFVLPTWLTGAAFRITGFDTTGQLIDVQQVVDFAD